MSEYMQSLFQGVSILCDYICKMQEVEKERFRIATEAEITHRKISITEKVAMARLAAQKEVLEKSIDATATDLASLGVSRERMLEVIGRLAESVVADDKTPEERERAFNVIEIMRNELDKLREDSMVKYELLSHNILQALEAPLSGLNFLEIGDG